MQSSPPTSSIDSTSSILNTSGSNLSKCCGLNDLQELNYFPYNSCTSLTIYSYKYWPAEKKFLVATKENNLKEIYFKTCFHSDSTENLSFENTDYILSTRSSVSSNNSNKVPNTGALNQNTQATTDDNSSKRKSSIINSIQFQGEEKSSINEIGQTYLEPIFKIHRFTNISSENVISSIDIIDVNNFSVFAVTFVSKKMPEQFFLHFYSDFETSNLETILECGQEFELKYLPHRVTHLNHLKGNKDETFIFVNCSNKNNFAYSIDIKNRKFCHVENFDDYFIELKAENMSDNITYHDIKYLTSKKNSDSNEVEMTNDRRLTAICCQNGWLGVFFVDSIKNEILKYWSYENDSFVTQVQFFTTKCIYDWSTLDYEKLPINLLVLRTLEPIRIFNNVLFADNSYESYQDLDIPSSYDLITSCAIFDVTLTGYNSIVLGTFGKVLLFFTPELTNREDSDKPQIIIDDDQESLKAKKLVNYVIKREITFKHSILGLSTTFLTSNGALDLVVLTLNGVSIWQYDPEKLIDFINKKLEQKEQLSYF